MYSVTIRDHIMIAHSLGKDFGLAAHLHGATYVIDVTFFSEVLNENNIVIDIDIAGKILHRALDPLRYKNLDDLPQFKNQCTTTEFLAKYIHQSVKELSDNYFKGKIKVTLGESPIARASYES